MVVLSVSILSKTGKVLVARQYMDMSRIRIEGVLAAFPKLIESSSEGGSSRQHTYVETGSIRYVYQPMDGLYLVLVTSRGSNIVQDLDTLRLLSKVVPEYAQLTEEDVSRNAFDLIFAFDEVLCLGYKENITLDGIRTNLEMDSHNEKLFLMVQQSKEKDAREEGKRREQAIRAARAKNPMPGMGNNPMQGMGNTTGFGSDSMSGFGSDSLSSGMESSKPSLSDTFEPSGSRYGSSAEKDAPASKGLKLGSKGLKLGSKTSKGLSALQQMAKEEGIDANALLHQQSSKASTAVPGAVVRSDPIEVRINEMISATFDKDDALHKVEVKGSITLTCHEENAKVRLQLEYFGDTSPFQFTPHPNLSKPEFSSSNVLQLKDPSKPFPKDKALGILKWRYAAKEDTALVPLSVTCWPEDNGDGTVTVSLSLELLSAHLTLRDVVISIPLSSSDEPEITEIEGGMHRHNAKKHLLEWELGIVDKDNKTASLNFVAASNDEDDFFPVTVTFSSQDTVCPIHVAQVDDVESSEPCKFGLYRELQTAKYEIVAHVE